MKTKNRKTQGKSSAAKVSRSDRVASKAGRITNPSGSNKSSKPSFASFIEHMPGFVWMKNLEGRYVYANSAVEELVSQSSGCLGKTDLDLWPEDIALTYRANDLKVITEKKPIEMLEPYEAHGEVRFVVVSKFPIFDSTGAVTMVGGAGVDITSYLQAGETLREYERAVEGLEEMITVVDRNYRYKLANRAFLDRYGLTREQVVGSHVSEVLNPIVFEEWMKEKLEECFNGQLVRYELKYPHPKLGDRHLLNAYFPIDGKNGIDRIACVTEDTTERKRAEAALRESEQELRVFNLATNDLFWNWDFATDKVARSTSFEKVFGYSEAEIDPSISWWQERLHPDDRERVLTEFRAALNRGDKVCSYEYRFRRRDSSYSTISDRAYIVRDASGNGTRAIGAMSDITQRKQSEAALRLAEQKYRDIFDSAPVGIYQSRPNGTLITCNQALAKMLGYESVDELLQVRIDRDVYLDAEDRSRFITRYAGQSDPGDAEVQWKKKDGTPIWVQMTVHDIKGADGSICFEGFVRDVTEQKNAAQASRESEERYRELFENSRDAVYVHDLTGRYVSVNRAAEELSGFSREEIIGRHYSNFISPGHLKDARESFCLKLDVPVETTYEAEVICKTGERKPVEVSSRMIYREGEPVGIQGTVRDISERKRADEARARLALIVESTEDAIIGKTLDGTIVSWNSGAERIYGYSEREIIGFPVSILVPLDRRADVHPHLERLRRGESLSHFETLGRRKDGTLIHVSLTISPIRDASNRIVGASTIARDITRSRQAEDVLQNYSRRLIDAQEAERQRIARELHDEIGQVLTAVRLNLQSIQNNCQTEAYLSRVDESVEIVDQALQQVRELSFELRPALLDDLGLAAALRWYAGRYALRSGIAAEVSGDAEVGSIPRDVETACFRIAQEALSNVARHSRAKKATVRLERFNGQLRLTIHDDGIGFDSDLLLTGNMSAALGLHGMRERARALKGNVEIESSLFDGAKVVVNIPLKT